ncbi:hypothetical protein [Nitratireductor rhodophyticola]|nr:hypothetical protein [Pseudomonadota bacterium]
MTRNRRHRTGRSPVPFSVIEKLAASLLDEEPLFFLPKGSWCLTRHSALYRRKNGTYTLCLVWHGDDNSTLTQTVRGLELEVI